MWKNNIATGDYKQVERESSGIKIHYDVYGLSVIVDYYGSLDVVAQLIQEHKTPKNYFVSVDKSDIESIEIGLKSQVTSVSAKVTPLTSVVYKGLGLGLKDKPYYYCSYH